MRALYTIVGLAVLLIAAVGLVEVWPHGGRVTSPVTNARGIPFPRTDEGVLITQALAHFNVYLREPVLFKELYLTWRYRAGNATSLSVGVRENGFWLSYSPEVFYARAGNASDNSIWHTATISLPLTDKLQEPDRSVDVMLFANNQREGSLTDEVADTTQWYIDDIEAAVRFAVPQASELRDYVKAVITRERPL